MSKIQTALNAAMRDICKIGIGKTQKNEQQNYRFRGIEQAMNEMSPIMVNHGITVSARYADLNITERAKEKGALRFVTLKGTFTFTAEDDSFITSEAYGEAMDSGDKAVIKAQSVAYRTALFQLFVVPTMSMDTELDDYSAPETDPDVVAKIKATASVKALNELFRSMPEKEREPLIDAFAKRKNELEPA
jgi:GH25 family lysozyme M1 (1,4-beta-N-acetylmuramidase)